MSRYYGASSYGGWGEYVPVAERRRQAERLLTKLRKSGRVMAPVSVAGRTIATTFWGRAWCQNLESYGDYETRLPRGRSYVRNGLVLDLQIERGRITAMVSGSDLYTVGVTIKEAAKAHWRAICADCAGGIDSLVELLQGRFSKKVMERLCRQEVGLFPRPAEIRFTCSCPDHASMCKHVAAALYGVGARLDEQADLLFRLRAVDQAELIANIDPALPLAKATPDAARMLEIDDLSAMFGLDMAASPDSVAAKTTTAKETTKRKASRPAGEAQAAPERRISAADASRRRIQAEKTSSGALTWGKPMTEPKAQTTRKHPTRPISVARVPRAEKDKVSSNQPSRPTAPAQKQPGSLKPGPHVDAAAPKRKRAFKAKRVETRSGQSVAGASAAVRDAPAVARRNSSTLTEQLQAARTPKQKPVKWW